MRSSPYLQITFSFFHIAPSRFFLILKDQYLLEHCLVMLADCPRITMHPFHSILYFRKDSFHGDG